MKFLSLVFLSIALVSCAQEKNTHPEKADLSRYQTAYFASGCFWCLEAIFETVDGVVEAESGYSGGTVSDPSYEMVCTGSTGHAETVKVYYDSSKVNFYELVEVFFNSHDPTTENQQGPDYGTQYRSAIFFTDSNEKNIAESYIKDMLETGTYERITTEVTQFNNFYLAEEYHQDYVKKNQEKAYVQRVSLPRLQRFFNKMPEYRKSYP